MKQPAIRFALTTLIISLLVPACIAKPTTCKDPLGCVLVPNKGPIKISVLLTLTGPDSPYGIDALRGVEIALAEQPEVAGHPVQLEQVDDLCTAEGGEKGATQIAADPAIVGVIGTSCSSSSVPAAKILSEAGMVMISPSSTAPSLTAPDKHQPGFFRTIYNDRAQGKAVADFAYHVLGLRSMSTIDDGTPYSMELTAAACEDFKKLGGACLGQVEIQTGSDLSAKMLWLQKLDTDVLYLPVYTVDGVNIVQQVAEKGIRSALISSDGLLSTDFIEKTADLTEGMYLSGPAPVPEPAAFLEKFRAQYGGDPGAAYHLQAYDAARILLAAIEKAAVPGSSRDGSIFIQRQALRDAIQQVRGLTGLSGLLTCSEFGDCAQPKIEIFQIRERQFIPIYP
ncbi:MAG: branched-chain amino acid ABC transporter substrate-binding protein [Bacteroidota bacterium]